jgi:ABC-type transport system involved in multi-copper enzyme maturation permease subunit
MRLGRAVLLLAGILVASFALYLGIAAGVIGVPGAPSSVFWDRVFPALSLCSVLVIDFSIALSWRRSAGRNLGSAFLYVSLAVFVGSVLVSLAVMREHWLEVMKELVRRI